ncbi:LLM class flavin-dependent oxidoreductase [Ktedonosporobacter rubrisoli]|uniref:LLM class flavin-dependent oxidoreductase n=1 Tax=Ktedonosporobacter rubrisoli TaxID=2509675 RepID=A0A4P6JYB9_KTERU|nr:LLM class flavin-dependent oxidoreductase [Ktedonosporobacter rubrisoli]QBD80798.1 LLM class flavin-dependent oxidoreductase [Ktedonosporobacter rubrisoli]
MAQRKVQFGLTLPNRGVIIGATTIEEMLALGEKAEAAGWDSVWVGDSIFAKPRLDSLVLLGGLAARTKRVKLGPACFASTPLRNALLLAYQWHSLDFMSGGRTIFVACQGAPAAGGGKFSEEFEAFHVEPSSRMRRMEEAIDILRLTSIHENVSYQGEYNQFKDITVLPRPVQQPLPIWVTANPREDKPKWAESALRRVAKYGDGWMTTRNTIESFSTNLALIRRYAQEDGHELSPDFEACLYYNINVNEDREAALAESKRFLDTYYTADYSREFLENWVACGSPQECIAKLRAFIDAGATTITLRLTSYDQDRQFERVTNEVLSALS